MGLGEAGVEVHEGSRLKANPMLRATVYPEDGGQLDGWIHKTPQSGSTVVHHAIAQKPNKLWGGLSSWGPCPLCHTQVTWDLHSQLRRMEVTEMQQNKDG